MKHFQERVWGAAVTVVATLAISAATASTAVAKDWQAAVGAQSGDLAVQALAYLPNELWIHSGDSIRWYLTSTEIHTVSFLTPGQVRPPNWGMVYGVPVGCPGSTPDGAAFDGSTCVNSGILGQDGDIGTGLKTYSVRFPSPGNFKFNCLIHFDMTGTVHVLESSRALPYDQSFYTREAQSDASDLVSDGGRLVSRGIAENNDGGSAVKVTAGVGEIATTTGAGSQTVSLNRFLRDVVVIRVGDTVEWTNLDPTTPHTVTFGMEPTDPRPPFGSVTPTPDGARQSVITSAADRLSSGLLVLATQDRPNLPISPLGVTRFRVTFGAPGVFRYICALHDNLGMKGTVIVH